MDYRFPDWRLRCGLNFLSGPFKKNQIFLLIGADKCIFQKQQILFSIYGQCVFYDERNWIILESSKISCSYFRFLWWAVLLDLVDQSEKSETEGWEGVPTNFFFLFQICYELQQRIS